MEFKIAKYRPIIYKATKKNRNCVGFNFITTTRVSKDEYGRDTIELHLNHKFNDKKALIELAEYINSLLSCDIHYNKYEQLKQILKQHYMNIGMSEEISEKIKKVILNSWEE